MRRAVSVKTVTSVASSHSARSVSAWRDRRCGQHGVQRHHHRLAQLASERQHVRAVRAPEDAVLVLDHDDVHAAAVEQRGPPRRSRRAGPVDALDDLGRLFGVGVAHDRREVDRGHGSAASSASRRSREKVPMPQARGG